MPAKRSFLWLWVCVASALVALFFIIPGVLGFSSYLDYRRREKTEEAVINLSEIRQRLEAYRSEHGQYPRLPPTPSLPPSAMRRAWPASADPGWAQLRFQPVGPSYFSYEVLGDTDSYVARAHGDLDGDGEQSIVEIRSTSSRVYLEHEGE